MNPHSISFYLSVVTGGVALDQFIKYLVETGMDMHVQLDLLPFLALFRTHNTGIAFSMFSGFGSLPLIAVTLLVIGVVSYIAIRTPGARPIAHWGFALILAGAIGNLIDRAWLGYVVDYVLFHTPGWSFAIFNLADAFISVGAALIVLDEALAWRRERKTGG